MIQCLHEPVKPGRGRRTHLLSNWLPLAEAGPTAGPPLGLRSARAAQPAGGVAGDGIALHAEPADVDALAELPRLIVRAVGGDAGALLGCVVRLLRAGADTHREDRQVN